MNDSGAVVPAGVVTVTFTAPAAPGGVTQVLVFESRTATFRQEALPTETLAPGTKFVPVMTSVVPPPVGPIDGVSPVVVGGTAYVNAAGAVAVPSAVVTATSTGPTAPVGVSQVIVEESTTDTLVHAFPPTSTVDPAVKFPPLIVIWVPPLVEPEFGLTEAIVGAGPTMKDVLATWAKLGLDIDADRLFTAVSPTEAELSICDVAAN